MKVGVKYCGGCNPRYDRVAEVNKLKAEFPTAEFVTASLHQDCDIVLVVCGCFAACAEKAGLKAKDEMRTIWQLSDIESARQKLRSVCPDWKELSEEELASLAGITKSEETKALEAAEAASIERANKAEAEEAERWFKMILPLSGK